MTKQLSTSRESGFTLVELAIVLMIIGLLIGGILRGQELMENARVTSTIQQTKAYDGATTTFRDQYSALPGDITTPNTRLPNCAAGTLCATAGNNDGLIGAVQAAVANPTGTALTNENVIFWNHLASARLIQGINPTAAGAAAWGQQFPTAKIGGGFHLVQMNVAAVGAVPAVSGIYLNLRNAAALGPINGGAVGTNVISPSRAAQIDNKMDDGIPQSGDVIGVGAAGCVGAAYTQPTEQKNCNLLIKVQS